MTTGNGREDGADADREGAQEQQAAAKAARALGLWAAQLMGLESPHRDDYADAVIRHGGEDAMARKIAQDLAGAGLKVNEDQVRGKHDEFLAVARGQVQGEG